MVLQNTHQTIRTQANNRPVVLHVIYTFNMGGAQRRIIDLIHDPAQAVYHVVLALDGNYGAAQRIDAGAPYMALDIDWTPQPVYKAIAAARRVLKQIQPDVVCGYNWAGAEWSLAARLLGISRVFQIEDGFGVDESRTLSKKRGYFRTFLHKSAKCVKTIVVSHTLKQIAQSAWHIPDRKILHISNGVDIAHIQAGQDRPAPLLPEGKVVLGWLGALRPEKRVDLLLEAFQTIPDPDVKLVVMGDGPLRETLQAKVKADPRVTFTGSIDDPAAYLTRLDGFVLTSQTEQTPYVIMEAMTAGLACLTTDVGDCKRMLSPENARFVVDASDLPHALQTFIRDADARATIGRANRVVSEKHFSLSRMREEYQILFS